MKFLILIYNGFIWGLLAAVLITRSQWIDMRISVGLIIPAVLLITVIAAIIAGNKLKITAKFTLANVIGCFVLTFLVLGTKRLAVVPASIIRETINMNGISFSVINWVLLIVLALGLITIWIRRSGSNL